MESVPISISPTSKCDKIQATGNQSIFIDWFISIIFKPAKAKYTFEEVILQLAYPRLDINVTKGLNHLLKSPFCVHPKTGKIEIGWKKNRK